MPRWRRFVHVSGKATRRAREKGETIMKRILLGTLLATLSVGSMAFAGVKTDYDHTAHFERYRTFAWKMPAQVPGNGVVNNSLVASRIEQAVDRDLMSKGLQQANSDPDVYVMYHIGAKSQKDLQYFPGWGRGRFGWYGGDVFVNRYIKESVVIDLVDAHTNQLVWRAFMTDTGSHLSDVQKDKTIAKMVDSAFKHFPPKQG
jgi:Domain of unknown function (DUF4136)